MTKTIGAFVHVMHLPYMFRKHAYIHIIGLLYQNKHITPLGATCCDLFHSSLVYCLGFIALENLPTQCVSLGSMLPTKLHKYS